jgi:hypothetical protein
MRTGLIKKANGGQICLFTETSVLVNLILSILEQRFVIFLLPGTSGAAVRLDVSVFFSGPPAVADTEDAGVSVTL